MTLEDAIKQSKPFDCPYEKALVNLMFTRNWLDNGMRNYFKEIGVTNKQYNILRILNGAKVPVSTSFIRDRMLDKLSDVSRIIDRMEKNSLVTKKSNSKDKRLVDLTLSSKGKKVIKEGHKRKRSLTALLQNLSKKEVETLNQLLDKIRN